MRIGIVLRSANQQPRSHTPRWLAQTPPAQQRPIGVGSCLPTARSLCYLMLSCVEFRRSACYRPSIVAGVCPMYLRVRDRGYSRGYERRAWAKKILVIQIVSVGHSTPAGGAVECARARAVTRSATLATPDCKLGA